MSTTAPRGRFLTWLTTFQWGDPAAVLMAGFILLIPTIDLALLHWALRHPLYWPGVVDAFKLLLLLMVLPFIVEQLGHYGTFSSPPPRLPSDSDPSY